MDLNQSGINKKQLRGTKEGKECGVDGIEGEEEVCVRDGEEEGETFRQPDGKSAIGWMIVARN